MHSDRIMSESLFRRSRCVHAGLGVNSDETESLTAAVGDVAKIEGEIRLCTGLTAADTDGYGPWSNQKNKKRRLCHTPCSL